MNIIAILGSGRFINLPRPILIGLLLATGGGIMGGTFLVSPANGKLMPMAIVGIGLIFVCLLFMLFRAIVKWNAKRKANPMAAGLAGNAAAAPQGISEPARRARLDDLRRNFEQGVEKFRAAGKNLYSVPWYVLVGEPGSGKTEAIRHCNVGFPPGLQDQLQGAGGTLNMNWWFTNSAIILDTAGRLMFEEVAPGSTNEWNEFLKLLRQNRPNSPINGLLLVIPVDTLIKDSADSIEKKATKIAQQFDQIQRILGVRFPVFVIITKCDLLNGFREFFDDLNDPQLQHQIMGWSNPAPLDERFDPAKVTNHLETVKQRLIARRQNLLLDPVNTEDPQSRRVDQVDALYALPDSLINIGPRLRRYLEMIFVAGEWSPKPLFLRGIYFTSSMTEGAALDDELAKALGVPVDSLPGGAIFRKDRAYFLRDLFLEKVFREKGLVTRATNADKQQRTRRMLVMCFGFFAVVILFGVTFWASWELKKSLGGEVDLWNDAAKQQSLTEIAIIDKNGKYHGDSDLTIGSTTSLADFYANNLDRMKSDLQIPLVFRPLTLFDRKGINEQRRTIYRRLFEVTILKPAYDRARANLLAGKPPASDAEASDMCDVLAQLMKLEYASAVGKAPAAPAQPAVAADFAHPQADLEPIFRDALITDNADVTTKSQADFKKDKQKLQTVMDWIYTDQANGEKAWPPAMLGGGTNDNHDKLVAAIKLLSTYWASQTGDSSLALSSISATKKSLQEFRDAEANLLALRQTPIDSMDHYAQYRAEWKKRYDVLDKAAAAVRTAWADASKDGSTLATIYTNKKKATLDNQTRQIKRLLDLVPPGSVDKPASADDLTWTQANLRQPLEAASAALSNWQTNDALAKELTDLDTQYLVAVKDSVTATSTDFAQRPRFEVQAALYKLANDYMTEGDGIQLAAGEKLPDAIHKADAAGSAALDKANSVKTQNSVTTAPTDFLGQAISLATYTLDGATRARRNILISSLIKNYPADVSGWNAYIAKLAKEAPREARDAMARPRIPLVAFPAGQEDSFNDQFCPWAAGAVADRMTDLNAQLVEKDAPAKILDAADLKTSNDAKLKSFGNYKDAYINYWRVTVKDEIVVHFSDFKSFHLALSNATDANINDKLTAYGEAMANALVRISRPGDPKEADIAKAADDIRTAEPGKNGAPGPGECASFRKYWNELGDDPFVARQIILERSAQNFSDWYTVPSSWNGLVNPNSYTVHYWSQLPVNALNILATECQTQIQNNLQELAKYEKFPFAPMTADPKNDATADDITKLRAVLKKIGTAAAPAATTGGAPAVPGNLTIRAGGTHNNPDINDGLVRLRGDNLISKETADYLVSAASFLDALPADKPVIAVVTPMLDKLKDAANPISNPRSYMRVTQEGKPAAEISIIGGGTVKAADIDYPGGGLKIDFKSVANSATYDGVQNFAGPWALLRLLNDKKVNASSLTHEGNKWVVEYAITLPGSANPFSLWLSIEFKQALPDLSKWPVPPAPGH